MPSLFCKILICALALFVIGVHAGDAVITKLNVPTSGKTGFTLIDPQKSGVQFINPLSEARRMTNANLMNGSGVALGDFDGDGLCDIYFCSLGGSNVLYKNLGNFTFKDVTAEAGVACAGQTSTGAIFADIDGDGDLDLLVTSMGGPNACFINDGKGHFTDQTAAAGLTSQWGSSSMALADIDGNGTLDLYVCNYGATSILRSGGSMAVGKNARGEPVVLGRNSRRMKIIEGVLYELGEPDILYLNDGHGHFTPVRWPDTFKDEQGQPLAEAPWDQSLSVMIRDLNEDSFPDIYVCSDAATPDRIWLNDGHGKFRAAPTSAIRKTSYFTMGIDVADIDRDGHDDILTVDMLSHSHEKRVIQQSQMHPQPNVLTDLGARFQVRRNVLLWGDGRGNFTELGNYSGLAASDWTWSCVFLDVDLDGWEDVLITNGFEHDVDDADVRAEITKMGNLPLSQMRRTLLKYPKLSTPNYAFRNLHNRTFKEIGAEWGFNSTSIANGMALADLDNDGDLDVVVNCMNSVALVYRNDSPTPRVAVRLKGNDANTQGIGARITVKGGPITQTQTIISGGRYVSSDQAERVFAAGTAANVSIQIDWPSGARSEVANVPANSLCEITEPANDTSIAKQTRSEPTPLFTNESGALNHVHTEAEYDDFARQPSLPRQLSRSGPVLCVADLNQDGLDDLIIGAGKSGIGAVFLNDHGKLQPTKSPFSDLPAHADDTAILAFHKSDQVTVVLRAESNYEEPTSADSIVHVFEISNNGWTEVQSIRVPKIMIGSLALAALQGNNSLALFVGGRCIPGEYPRAASSFIYRYNGKTFDLDEKSSEPFRDLGLVTGAVFSDLNADGSPDLILSCEWSRLRIFLNNKGALTETTFDSPPGLWLTVATGDINGDGLPDIIAGNWGLNSLYNSRGTQHIALYHGDLNDDGHETMFEAYEESGRWLPFHDLGTASKNLPWLTTSFPTYAAYAKSTANEILVSHIKKNQRLEVTSLESCLFLNHSNIFERIALPAEAQFSTANGITVADFNNDGIHDIFLAQNFYAVRSTDERLDAGRGLLLLGNTRGGFIPTDQFTAGISMLGQHATPAVADFANTGKPDLVVAQNSGGTQLFRNSSSRGALRVKLRGPAGNLDAIGAQLRAKTANRLGPTHEIQSASGSVGQSSFVQLFAAPEPITALHILWPGGKSEDYPVPVAAKTITIDFEKGVLPEK